MLTGNDQDNRSIQEIVFDDYGNKCKLILESEKGRVRIYDENYRFLLQLDGNIVGISITGSHMWKMNNRDSDYDLFVIYNESINKILDGTASFKSFNVNVGKIDLVAHEASKVVEQLIKSNINFVLGTLSTIINMDTENYAKLRKIVSNNLSKHIYYSSRGLAVNNYRKYILSGNDTSESRCNKICRVLNFAISVIKDKEVKIEPYKNGTPEKIEELIKCIDKCYRSSKLPEYTDEFLLREWLYNLRFDGLKMNCRYHSYIDWMR